MKTLKEKIKTSTEFSNFAQKVKMKYWATITETEPGRTIKEPQLDELLLIAFEELEAKENSKFDELERRIREYYYIPQHIEIVELKDIISILNEMRGEK